MSVNSYNFGRLGDLVPLQGARRRHVKIPNEEYRGSMIKFNQWVSSIADAGRELLSRVESRQEKDEAITILCRELCTSKGEAMGTAIAHGVVKAYRALSAEGKKDFFELLVTDYSPDPAAIIEAAEQYKQTPDRASYKALSHVIEARRQNLFRRINMAPEGTATLIQMRKDLLGLLPENDALRDVDSDLKHLMFSWFNRGFLTLEQISWKTPAHILEKLIAYEAVHEMEGWDDLRRRLADDRRCFAFFHPALEDEPLIFVEVALVKGIARNVQVLLQARDDESAEVTEEFDTAIFYSISNCQEGLKGISFGNFLIKQVVMELRNEFPQLKQFATLSPIPGFMRWLKKARADALPDFVSEEGKRLLGMLDSAAWINDPACVNALEPVLMKLCAHYLSQVKRKSLPADPVARFHLGNGAQIARLNWQGDSSDNGIQQSAGILVNYAYQLQDVERNHEAFVNQGVVAASSEFQKILK